MSITWELVRTANSLLSHSLGRGPGIPVLTSSPGDFSHMIKFGLKFCFSICVDEAKAASKPVLG